MPSRLAVVGERLRQSLFAIPGLCLLLGVLLAEVMVRLDRAGAGSWLPDSYETDVESATEVLGAIATGTITVVTLLLTLTLVAIQLAAGQLSPRTIVNFLGDRFQQATVGVVLGTATFSLLALRALRVADGDGNGVGLTVMTAVVLTVASLVMLVLSADRTAKRLAVGTLLNDLADETCELVEQRYIQRQRVSAEHPGRLIDPSPGSSARERHTTISVVGSGWVQYIDERGLLQALPQGASIELLHPVGTFVLSGMELVRVDVEDLDDEKVRRIRRTIAVGEHRTMQQDVSFGLTRLNDIALRALSPGVNDPNTAREVVLRIAQVVLALQACELDAEVSEVEGHTVVRRGSPTHDDFVRDGFDQIRLAATHDRATLVTMRRALTVLLAESRRRSLPGSTGELARQAQLVEEMLGALSVDGVDGDAAAATLGMRSTLP